ncbi:hypothetical protein C8R42DRAFT_640939 [Lentinula raphanica]|nr:hypothetical protein C8R42DRAFT_640939 [Lentinula raphanica]
MSLTHFDSLPLIYPEESTWPHPNDDTPLRKEISDVEHELLLLERQISELSRIKEAKKAELGMLRNELAPIHRLPLEIISRIFEEACHPGVDVTQANSALTAAFIPRHSKAIKCDPSWVKRWLDRSGTLPIDLDLDFSRRGNLALRRDQDANKLMMLILDFCERIRSLKTTAGFFSSVRGGPYHDHPWWFHCPGFFDKVFRGCNKFARGQTLWDS